MRGNEEGNVGVLLGYDLRFQFRNNHQCRLDSQRTVYRLPPILAEMSFTVAGLLPPAPTCCLSTSINGFVLLNVSTLSLSLSLSAL